MKKPNTTLKKKEVPEDTQIDDIQLHYNQYKEPVLKKNIDRLFRKTLLNTQILSEEFCAEHIFSMKIPGIEGYEEIDMKDILQKQPHLNEKKLAEAINRFWYKNTTNKLQQGV